MRSRWFAVLLFAVALPGASTTANAQLQAIDALASKVTDVGVFAQYRPPWTQTPLAVPGHHWDGFGVELSYTVFTKKHATSTARPRRLEYNPTEQSITAGASGVTTETKSTITVKPPEADSATDYYVELGIAYTQTQLPARRFAPIAPGVDSVEVRGWFREFPAISAYISYENPLKPRMKGFLTCLLFCIDPYVGLYGGLVNVNAQGFAPVPPSAAGQPGGMTSVKADGSTFEGGLVAGLSHDIGSSLHAFAEVDRAWRAVPALGWTGASNGIYPPTLPRSLDLTAWSISIGTQVHIGTGK